MTPPDSPLGRRAALALAGSSLLALVVAACAGTGGEPSYRGGRRRRRDGVPFWHREEQRD
jgi:hypothetical protein